MNRVYGIDLGTTYSCIAYVDEAGKPVVVNNSDNAPTTPSVVYFETESNIAVGQTAKEVARVYPSQVVSRVKRFMGREDWKHHAFGKDWTPQEISSLILKKLVNDARDQLGVDEIRDVVITCPAYFGAVERSATMQAGRLAGLDVKYVIPEPVAAALAFGLEQERDQTVLVFDLGGGTFDVTLVSVKGGHIEVLEVEGDHELGGKDWDEDVSNYLFGEFARQSGIAFDDLQSDPSTVQDFLKAAEEMKIGLTNAVSRKRMLASHGQNFNIELTRSKFDELTKGRLLQAIDITRKTIDLAKQNGRPSIDLVLLVGGSTYMPQVRGALEQFGIEVKAFQPHLAVAMGAALYGAKCALDAEFEKVFSQTVGGAATPENVSKASPAQMKRIEEEVRRRSGYTLGAAEKFKGITIDNVTSKGFGLMAFSEKTSREVIFNLVWKGDKVPTSVTESFSTHASNQREAALKVFENDHRRGGDLELDPSDPVVVIKSIGEAILAFDRPLPKNSPIEVEFRLGPDAVLHVHGKDLTTNGRIEAEFKTDALMSAEEVEISSRLIQRLNVS